MEPSLPVADTGRISLESLNGIPFNKKWDILKPVIKQLYIDQNLKLPDLIKTIADEYGFVAMSVLPKPLPLSRGAC